MEIPLVVNFLGITCFTCVKLTQNYKQQKDSSYLVAVSKNQRNFVGLKWFTVLEENLRGKRLEHRLINTHCAVLYNHTTIEQETYAVNGT